MYGDYCCLSDYNGSSVSKVELHNERMMDLCQFTLTANVKDSTIQK